MMEYVVVVGVLVAALIAMKVYLQRGLQQKYRSAGDVFGYGEQYDKRVTHVTDLDGEPVSDIDDGTLGLPTVTE